MGTELVPFKSWSEWTAWHRNLRRKSATLHTRFSTTLLGLAVAVVGVWWVLSQVLVILANAFAIAVVGILFYERIAGARWHRRNRIADLPNVAINFPCPDCNQNFNIGHAWVCGWCKEEHSDWLPTADAMQSPALGCSNPECEETKVHELSGGRGDQAAVQCPSCACHIVLDPRLYELRQCHMSPYSGVARFVGDTRDPVNPRPVQSVFPVAPGSPEPETKSRFGTSTKDRIRRT